MCGISGISDMLLSLDSRISVIEKMISCMHHRGPDTNASWSDEYISLGHNRLSIIDLSDNGKQPMHKGDWVITYNGEIYNYLEIKNELINRYQIQFSTMSDTEVILSAWNVWGEKALNKFRGMWAFALYNKKSHQLFLCRDRFGIKPLYYYNLNGHLIFASEIKAILEDGCISRRARLTTIIDFFMGFNDHNEATFLENIYQIEPGCYMNYDLVSGSKEISRYYDLEKATEGKISTIEQFTEEFEESVRFHLRSDVPIGTCLSGGLDSSSIAALAARDMRDNTLKSFHAVTAQSEDPTNDETEYARAVVEHSSLTWHITKPSADDYIQYWQNCQWYQEEPIQGPSIFMQYCVMRTAKQIGLKVMLDGQGGDEILLGYERYYPTYFLDCVKRGRVILAIKSLIESVRNSRLSSSEMIMYCGYFLLPGLRELKNKKKWEVIPGELLEHGINTLRESSNSYTKVRKLQISEVTKYSMPALLKYEDRNSMAWSIEARVPFVDFKLIEAAITLPPDSKISDGFTKWALRRAMNGRIPDRIAWRKNKIGFEAPDKKWLHILKAEIDDKIAKSVILRELRLSENLEVNTKFLLYSLASWEDMFAVNLH